MFFCEADKADNKETPNQETRSRLAPISHAFGTYFSTKLPKCLAGTKKNSTFALALSPDGGIGRRAGLKHQWGNPCRFDPGSGYRTRLVIKRLLTLFLFKGGSKNYGFKFLAILMFSVSDAFRLFGVILSSLISHIARCASRRLDAARNKSQTSLTFLLSPFTIFVPSSTYKSTFENRTKINST